MLEKSVWQGAVPVKVSVDRSLTTMKSPDRSGLFQDTSKSLDISMDSMIVRSRCVDIPDYQILMNRGSYLPLYTNQVRKFFVENRYQLPVGNELTVWFSYEGTPLKW
jgi:hypothetical protein